MWRLLDQYDEACTKYDEFMYEKYKWLLYDKILQRAWNIFKYDIFKYEKPKLIPQRCSSESQSLPQS